MEKCFQNPLFDVMVDITKEADKEKSDHGGAKVEHEVIEKDNKPVDKNLKQFLEKNFEEMEAKIEKEASVDDGNLVQSEEVQETEQDTADAKIDSHPPEEEEKLNTTTCQENPLLVEF